MNKPGKKDIYIIFEGPTEEKFIRKLQDTFFSNYNLYLINAKGKDNIIKEYKKVVRKVTIYSEVVVMYDLDRIDSVLSIYNYYMNKGINIKIRDIYFINPQFELLFILAKSNKTPIDNYELHIKNLYDIDHYSKKNKELDKIVKNISKEELIELFVKLKKLLSKNDKELRSTNYDNLFNKLFEINK